MNDKEEMQMVKKYELTAERKVVFGRTLYQKLERYIQATSL